MLYLVDKCIGAFGSCRKLDRETIKIAGRERKSSSFMQQMSHAQALANRFERSGRAIRVDASFLSRTQI